MMINIDLLIIGIFLMVTLAIGMYYSRGITTFRDYAVGNRKTSTMVLTTSLIATVYGAKALHVGFNDHYREGFYAFKYLSGSVSVYLASRFLIVRMKEFVGHLSIAESMGSIYGPTVRTLTAILGIILSITILAAQIKIGLDMTIKIFPHSARLQIMMASLLVIGYATFGGARAVALTDLYQFLLFGLYVPMLLFVLLYYYNGNLWVGLKNLTTMPQFNLNSLFTWHDTLKNNLTWLIWWSLFTSFNPAYIQRFYMASSLPQAVKVFKRSSMIRILFFTPLFLIVAVALHLSGSHGIQSHQSTLDYIMHLNYWPGMQGVFITAIFALLMSTADSVLHIASVLFTHDIWPTLTASTLLVHQNPLRVARIVSVFIGCVSLMVAFHITNMMSFLNKARISLFYHLAVGIPFIMTCWGFRPRSAAMLLSMGINTTIALLVTYYKYKVNDHLSIIFILSILGLFIPHYLLPKSPNRGWVGVKDCSLWNLHNQATKRWWQERLQQLKRPFTKNYREILFPKKERTFMLFGSYLVINTIIALCFIKPCYFFPSIYGYMVVMAMGTIIALYPALHSYQPGGNPLLHRLWIGLLFMVLFIAPIQEAKLGHFSPMLCTLLLSNLSLAVVFLSLEVSLVMLGVALFIHNYIPPYVPFCKLFLFGYKDKYTIELLFATALFVAAVVGLSLYTYLRNVVEAKFKIMELTRAYEHKIAVEAIYHQANCSRLDMTYGSQLFNEMEQRLKDQEKQAIPLLIDKLRQYNHLLLNKAAGFGLDLDPKAIKPVTINPIITKADRAIRRLGDPLQLLLRNQTVVTQLIADPALFECLLLLNLGELHKCTQARDHIVTLTISDTTLRYNYAIASTSGQALLNLPALAFCFSTETSIQNILPIYDIKDTLVPTWVPKTENQFYQVESKQIVQAHGGYAEIIETQQVLTCFYVLPVNGKKVMQVKIYDPADLAANKVAETPESLAQEKELFFLLTSQTTLTQEKVMETISFIKNAHGLVERKSGMPYYTHPMAVVKILLEVTQDPLTLLAGLLHDVIEDTPITLNQIEWIYGVDVASIVEKVTHYNTKGYPWKFEDQENKSMLNQCTDIRVVQVKLADRLHNLRTLDARKPADQQRIAKETLTFYIPWGIKNNGPHQWLAEMRAICAQILDQKG